MTELRHPPAADSQGGQRFVHHDLTWRGRQQVLTTQHVTDPHQRIVDRVHQGVQGLAVRADDDVVGHVDAVERDGTAYQIVERDLVVTNPHPYDEWTVSIQVRLDLLGREMSAMAVVAGRRTLGPGLFPLLDLFSGTKTTVGQVCLEQLLEYVAIDPSPFGLDVGPVLSALHGALVRVQTQPGQRVQQILQRFLGVPSGVGVFDPQHERAAEVPGERPVEQGAANVPHVQVAGRRGRKPDPDIARCEVAQHSGQISVSHDAPPYAPQPGSTLSRRE